ncbi:SRPBCC family protein [Kurthia sibirica]|uniref:SRPBCC family protein n=1 Tax=Kurthia sibirica TaxID=202750 RepID=A0A2U3AJP9_9BACL|nr:SRPBCC family protein [Kurthia sibirica]PWI24701.1 hypothetical protein DEX24_12095 [Kurthia sibirica]GEK34543.1 MxaD family protein [Kurthia sibirica]
MAKTTRSLLIEASPDAVWELIGGFDSLPQWLPYIPSSEVTKGGRIRHLANPDGHVIIEQLEVFDNAARTYSYSILQAPFPVTNYLATLQVHEVAGEKNTSLVEWSGKFTPIHNATDEEVIALFNGIFSDGLKAIKAAFLCKNSY